MKGSVLSAIAAVAIAASAAAAAERRPCRDVRFSLPPAGLMLYSDEVNRSKDGSAPYAKDPTVIRMGERYLMYYSATIVVNGKWCLGQAAIAESTDLVHWKRIGNLKVDGWKSVWGWVAPCVKKFDGKVHLFGQARQCTKAAPEWLSNIRHAVSDDGIRFRLVQPWPEAVFVPDNKWCGKQGIDAEVYRAGDRLMLMYASRAGHPKGMNKLGMAWAPYDSDWGPDKWTELTVEKPFFEPQRKWEMRCIEGPTVVEHDGIYYMFYAGAFNHERQQIGLAWSADGEHFTRWSDDPVLPHGPEGAWNAWESGHPGVFKDDDGQIYLFYQGKATQNGAYYLSCLKVEFVK